MLLKNRKDEERRLFDKTGSSFFFFIFPKKPIDIQRNGYIILYIN